MQAQLIKISQLKNNYGQVEGLPANPRLISHERFTKLVKSIKDDPEMLDLREVIAYDNDGELVVIAGNMRLKACRIFIKSRQGNDFSEVHKAIYPVAFAAYFIDNFSVQSCLDLFIGCGTTMVAAHQLNRKCYGMEIDPKYCQVVVDRMRKLDPSIKIKRNGKEEQQRILHKERFIRV